MSWKLLRHYISVITDVKSEVWFIIGAIQIVISIQSLQYFGTPLLKLNHRGESNTVHLALSSITGLSFLIFFAIGKSYEFTKYIVRINRYVHFFTDISYVNCFRMIAFFQFIMGGIWFANFTFKKVKHLLVTRG